MRKIIHFTIPPSRDWKDLGGRFCAVCEVANGEIVSATLYEWKVVKYVCFGRGDHVRGWASVARWGLPVHFPRELGYRIGATA